MKTEPTTFYSDGLKLQGAFFLPDGAAAIKSPGPVVIPCSGFTGLCEMHPARFARYLTFRGYQCFGFDYRGFAASEGERGRVLLEEQVRDIMSAVAASSNDGRIDRQQIVLLGWGMGAGLVVDAARRLGGIRGVVAVNGFYNGDRLQRAQRTQEEYDRFIVMVERERIERALTGKARRGDPFDVYPLDPQSRTYVDGVLRQTDAYDTEAYSYELADSLLGWNVEAHLPRMDVPLLLAHGDQNRLHPPSEARAAYAAYGGPRDLFWLEGAGHTEFMLDDDPRFQALAGRIERWIGDCLATS